MGKSRAERSANSLPSLASEESLGTLNLKSLHWSSGPYLELC